MREGDRKLTPEPDTSQSPDTARDDMVRFQIEARGVKDPRVLEAMRSVPRERFVPPELHEFAFEDRALPIAEDQTISQPFMVGSMTARLQVQPTDRVLEIGTGSGYQTAILSRLAHEIVTIERIGVLQSSAGSILESLNVKNVHFHVGDGTAGWPPMAPYDGIIVTAGAPDVPQPLIDQLADGGRLVVPVGGEKEQVLTLITRVGSRTTRKDLYPCRFVKLIGEHGWESA